MATASSKTAPEGVRRVPAQAAAAASVSFLAVPGIRDSNREFRRSNSPWHPHETLRRAAVAMAYRSTSDDAAGSNPQSKALRPPAFLAFMKRSFRR